MFVKSLTRQAFTFCKYKMSREMLSNLDRRKINVSSVYRSQDKDDKSTEPKEIVLQGTFESINDKNKNTYLELIRIYINRNAVHRRGHVEFIYAALKNMESFGVHKDLEVYKSLIDVMPKGKYIPQNMFQVEFMHYPKQQQCIIDLLEQMEDNGVMPDYEMEDMLMNIFGERAFPLRKFWRMMYWMPKFKNLSPWPVPDPLPTDILELAKIAIARISSADPQAELTVYQTADIKDSIEDTWIVSSQSPKQKQLLQEHDIKEPVYVEGSFRVWIKGNSINYFMLRANSKPIEIKYEDPDDVSSIIPPIFNFPPPRKEISVYPSVHEQVEGVILALCSTGTSSQDSLLSWIRHLEKDGNPALATIPIVFTLKSGERELATSTSTPIKEEDQKKIKD